MILCICDSLLGTFEENPDISMKLIKKVKVLELSFLKLDKLKYCKCC